MQRTQVMVFRGFLTLILIGLLVLTVQPVLAEDDSWSQFHGNTALTGSSSGEAPDSNELKWSSGDIGAVPVASPVIANEKVFVNCYDEFVCLDEATGEQIWSQSITPSSIWGSWNSPAYSHGQVYIASDKIYCFDEDGGDALWTYDIANDVCNGSIAVFDNYILVEDWNSTGSYCYCLNAEGGTLAWQFPLVGYGQGTPAYADGKVYLTSWGNVSGNVYCVEGSTGEEVWHTQWLAGGNLPDWDTCGSPCVADGKVFITTYNFYGYSELVALNAENGSFAWTGNAVEIERSDSTPAYYDGKLYLCGGCPGYSDEGERTYCYAADTGELIWRTAVGTEEGALDIGNWTCSVAVADGKVFVGKPDSSGDFDYCGLYALSLTDGSLVWSSDNGGGSPAICNGVVFTIGDGKVWAYGESSDDEYPDWDVNQDGDINSQDLILVGNYFGETGDPGWIAEDVNSDGVINVLDIILIGNHFGE